MSVPDFSARLAAAFDAVMETFNDSRAIRFLESASMSVDHYKAVLAQFYHYTKENPQLQGVASSYLRGSDRQIVHLFLRHAISEVGHDLDALKDLERLGEDVSRIPMENPLPATLALTAFAYLQLHHRNPVGFLGWMYFLEHMPTAHGMRYAQALARVGVPQEAMGFLSEHIQVDVGHNRLMEQYVASMVHDENDLSAVIYAIQVTGHLYAEMLWMAIQNAGRVAPFGLAAAEASRWRSGAKFSTSPGVSAH